MWEKKTRHDRTWCHNSYLCFIWEESFHAGDTVWAGVKTLFPKDGKEGQRARQLVKGLFCTNRNVTETYLYSPKVCLLHYLSFLLFTFVFVLITKILLSSFKKVTPPLFSRVPLMLHPPLDVFSRWDQLQWPISPHSWPGSSLPLSRCPQTHSFSICFLLPISSVCSLNWFALLPNQAGDSEASFFWICVSTV